MLPPTCVVVPTYWTRRDGSSRPGDAAYDHPTLLGGESTLPSLLESLEKLDVSAFYLLILVAVTGKDVAKDAEKTATDIVSRYPSLTNLVFGPSDLEWLKTWLTNKQLDSAKAFLDLKDYPKIRNLQLAVPLALGSESIVGLDDDEIVTDPQFLEKAVEYLGKKIDGVVVDGLSGHYLQADGSILLKVDPKKSLSPNVFDRKASIMNQGTEELESAPGNLVQTPFCFGGNMEFSRDLAATVGFDPSITRGEDIDYLINARMEGKHFFLRKDLRVLHCPPQGGSYKDASRSKLEQDVIRFLYERQKIRVSQTNQQLHSLTSAELSPYPGPFFEASLEEDATQALQEVGYEAGSARTFVEQVQAAIPGKIEKYLEFRLEWPRAMDLIVNDSEVSAYLQSNLQSAV